MAYKINPNMKDALKLAAGGMVGGWSGPVAGATHRQENAQGHHPFCRNR